MKKEQPAEKSSMQLYWGIALVLAGVAVLLRNMEIMPKLSEFQSYSKSLVVIFYCIGIVLIFGGIKKIIHHFKPPRSEASDNSGESSDP
jgi:uncharacterized membrane protein HdeD (DUF308 family)